jgi:hypothetical protein
VSSPIAPDPNVFAAAAARKHEVLTADKSADAWVRSVEAYMRAQGLPLDGEQSLALIETYLSPNLARRWEQRRQSLLAANKPVRFADLRNTVLTTHEGTHPADAARTAFTSLAYSSNKSLLDNLTGYRGAYETMITSCAATRIMPVAGYDLCNHLMQFLANTVRSVQSVILAHAQQVLVDHEAAGGFAANARINDEFYNKLFLTLLEQAQTLAPMVHHRNSVPLQRSFKAPPVHLTSPPAQPLKRRGGFQKGSQVKRPKGSPWRNSMAPTAPTQRRMNVGAFLRFLQNKGVNSSNLVRDKMGKKCLFCGDADHHTAKCDEGSLRSRLEHKGVKSASLAECVTAIAHRAPFLLQDV